MVEQGGVVVMPGGGEVVVVVLLVVSVVVLVVGGSGGSVGVAVPSTKGCCRTLRRTPVPSCPLDIHCPSG